MKAKERRCEVAAMTEGFAAFSKAVGDVSGWFTGCKCHDHIWTSSKSEQMKQNAFKRESGGLEA
eukprot:11964811-Prorocentrum_lima.AAC.1